MNAPINQTAPSITWTSKTRIARIGNFTVHGAKHVVLIDRRSKGWKWSITERAVDGSLVRTADEGFTFNRPVTTVIDAARALLAA